MEGNGEHLRLYQLKHAMYRWRATGRLVEMADKLQQVTKADKTVQLKDRFKISMDMISLKNDLFCPKAFLNRRYENKHVNDMR